jgi:hypothetical protein
VEEISVDEGELLVVLLELAPEVAHGGAYGGEVQALAHGTGLDVNGVVDGRDGGDVVSHGL